MSAQTANTVADHRLTIAEVLGLLVADGLVGQADADTLLAESRLKRLGAHPLLIIADQKWKSPLPPHRLLTLDDLGEWLAGKVGLEYYHIDPLKIDFTAVTEVMSSAYATRFGILPVQVTSQEVVVATMEPYLRDWEEEIQGIVKRTIRRVFASPLDVARYLVEFYNLARSVKKATKLGGQSAGLSSFEQLVELGRSNRQFDANDQHIVNIVDWLWQYAFEQRASDIHIEPRREIGIVRFRIDGVLHQVYQIPMSVMAAMVSRIKILGRMDLVEKRRPQDGRIKTRTADGQEAYTRAGNLTVDADGRLMLNGRAVLGEGGEITLPEYRAMNFGNDGTISITPPGGGALLEAGKLKLVQPAPQDLVKGSDGLFRLRQGGDAESSENRIIGNRFAVKTTRREQIAVDGSAGNLISGNVFEDAINGGIFLYRNAGEGGTIRHQPPQHNRIEGNHFRYEGLVRPRPAVWLNQRNGRTTHRLSAPDLPLGSSLDPRDLARPAARQHQ